MPNKTKFGPPDLLACRSLRVSSAGYRVSVVKYLVIDFKYSLMDNGMADETSGRGMQSEALHLSYASGAIRYGK